MVRQQQVVASHCIASWESFLNNSWYFYKIVASIRAEASVFYIFRLFHNIFFSSMHRKKEIGYYSVIYRIIKNKTELDFFLVVNILYIKFLKFYVQHYHKRPQCRDMLIKKRKIKRAPFC